MSDTKRIADITQKRWTRLNGQYQDVFDRTATYYEMYRTSLNFDDSYPWDYKLVEPVVFQLIRTMMSRLNPENARVDLLARNAKALAFRQPNQQLLNWELGEMNKTLVFYRALFRALIAGRSYVGTDWLFEPAVQIKGNQGVVV